MDGRSGSAVKRIKRVNISESTCALVDSRSGPCISTTRNLDRVEVWAEVCWECHMPVPTKQSGARGREQLA